MKKIAILALFAIAFAFTTSAIACPKGQHPHGGTGSHHKGGYCSFD
ncbi:hypothetical protein [Dryocola sp. BD613]